jgi:hypothetical protein
MLPFSVLSYVDGIARISLRSGREEMPYNEYFNGEIECVSKSVSIFNSSGFAFASAPLKDRFARISLRMSEERNPDVVECVIENMETF